MHSTGYIGDDLPQTFKEVFVVIVLKNFSVLDFADYNVVESTGDVYISWTSLTDHNHVPG